MSHSHTIKWQAGKFYLASCHQTLPLEQAWELPDVPGISDLHIDNAMQYLTSMEADTAMRVWVKRLSKGGRLTITVPDTNYFMKKWLAAEWTEETLKDGQSEARLAFAGLWGAQAFGNPVMKDYQVGAQGAYLAGFNESRLTLLLQRGGLFDAERINAPDGTLTMTAVKTMDKGERQVVTSRDAVRPDHLNRYEFAVQQLKAVGADTILDLACGVGYGSQLLALETQARITAVDIDNAALEHAKQYFPAPKIDYVLGDARALTFDSAEFDAIVSFETIEHVDFAEQLVEHYHRWLKPGGYLICSTPNQDVMPFDKEKFRFHVKHFTNEELVSLLNQAGFYDIELYAQLDPVNGDVVVGDGGCFTIVVARK